MMENNVNSNVQNENVNVSSNNTIGNMHLGNIPINNVETNIINNNIGNNYSKKSNKLVILGIILTVVVILGLGGLFGYKVYIGKSINLYKEAIKKTYSEFSNYLDRLSEVDIFNYKEDSLAISGDFKLNSNIPEMKDYTKYKYDFNVGLDIKNKKVELGASMSENSKDVIAAFLYLLDKTIYIDSRQAYNKVLYQVLEQDIFTSLLKEDVNVKVDYEKIDKLALKLSEYFSDSLSNKYLRKENDEIEVDSKKVKVKKVIYTLNSNSIYEITNSVLESMRSDDEFVSLIVEISGQDKEKIKTVLEDAKVSKDDFEMEEEIEFYLYTKGFFPKVIGFGINSGDTIISYADMNTFKEFSIINKDTKIVAKTVGSKTNGSVKVKDEQLATFTLVNEIDDKNIKLELSVSMSADNQQVVLDLKTNILKESDKKSKGTYITNISVTSYGKTQEVGAELNINAEIGAKDIANFNKSGAVNISTLTEKQLQQIGTNLEKALKNISFFKNM